MRQTIATIKTKIYLHCPFTNQKNKMIPLLLLYIIIFSLVYIIDLCTALLHRKLRPNNFARTEANQRFKKCIDQRGIVKGIGAYLILSSTESIILFVSVGIASRIVFGSTVATGLMFAFLFLSIVHGLGILTNVIALFKKDRKPVNTINQIGTQR